MSTRPRGDRVPPDGVPHEGGHACSGGRRRVMPWVASALLVVLGVSVFGSYQSVTIRPFACLTDSRVEVLFAALLKGRWPQSPWEWDGADDREPWEESATFWAAVGTLRLAPVLVLAFAVYHWLAFPFFVRGPLPRCRVCGYVLHGLTTPRCPECGTAI